MDMNVIYEAVPVKFYPYAHQVGRRIVSTDDYDEFQKFRELLLEEFRCAGIKAYVDNKCVFELDLDGRAVFVGFWDWQMNVGLSITER